MKLVVHEFLTIDGVMQGPGGPEEDRSGGFDRGGWLIPYADEDMGAIVAGWFDTADAILLGRNTYEAMHPYWSQVSDPDNTVAVVLNGHTKYVATSRPDELTWEHSERLEGDVIDAVKRLLERPGGELQVHGSAELASTLHAAGLVDAYRLLRFPVCVGAGKRLFGDQAPPTGFSVTASRTTGAGATYTELAPTAFNTGTAEVVDGSEVV